MPIAIQGIPGSFHHQVAINVFGIDADVLCFDTFEEIAAAVGNGSASQGVMAIENSIAGAILPNYEVIDRHGLFIQGEHYLPISHNLMALPGLKVENLQVVKSHPMAILQCQTFFQKHPHIKLEPGKDTASVAREISEKKLQYQGAIASHKAAEIYGLEILAENIQTVEENFTRFILLAKEPEKPAQIPNKASLKVIIRNEKGALAKLLQIFADQDLDLSKIQSIPVIEKPWDYAFFIDTLISDYSKYSKALEKVRGAGNEVKIFGEYISQKP
ncbi:prephenate dehydratase [Litoribacter alkaliphilus]|uniref:prephenate dehydratase n=1 Tax=Litoribacter ruber TaxID=702568 RepID=A0AAP2CG82_9BACT|nr:prephenate dehydratase [Litoribacter alkaliphilus]MBS9524068.1 prephenate dehydratase [Litoribacter alkaliphilus]